MSDSLKGLSKSLIPLNVWIGGQRSGVALLCLLCALMVMVAALSGCQSGSFQDRMVSQKASQESADLSSRAAAPMTEGGTLDSAVDNIAVAPGAAGGSVGKSEVQPEESQSIEKKIASNNSYQASQLNRLQIIKTAQVSLQVKTMGPALRQLEQMVRNSGGLITNESVSLVGVDSGYRTASLEVRVPQEALDHFVGNLETLGKVMSLEIQGRDVGAEIVDSASRIKNLKAEEAALQSIMQRAGKIPEILEVSQELARVRGEIEQTQGRLNYLKQQVAFSTVTFSISEEAVSQASHVKPGWDTVIQNTFSNVGDALDQLVRFCLEKGIWLLCFVLPILIVIGGIFIGIVRLLMNALKNCCRSKPKSEGQASPASTPAEPKDG